MTEKNSTFVHDLSIFFQRLSIINTLHKLNTTRKIQKELSADYN